MHAVPTGGRATASATTIAATLLLAVPGAAEQDSQTVDATVTADTAEACLTIDTASLAFGTLFFTPPDATRQQAYGTVDGGGHVYYLTSCSELTQRFLVRGTPATGTNPSGTDPVWELYPGSGLPPHPCNLEADVLTLEGYRSSNSGRMTISEVWRGGPSGSASVSPGASVDVRTRLTMPCVGSLGDGIEMSFQVQYLAEMTG